MKLHRDQHLLTCQLGPWVIEHAYQRDDRKARLQRVAPACAGTSHSSLAIVFSGSGSSRSPSGLLQVSPLVTVPRLKIGCIKTSSSVSCQMFYCINKGVSGEWIESYFPGSQETLQKWQKNDNTLKQAHNHYSAMFLLDETTFIHFLWHTVFYMRIVRNALNLLKLIHTLITPICKFIGIPSVFGSERKLHEINLSHICVQIHWHIPPAVLNNNYILRPDHHANFLQTKQTREKFFPHWKQLASNLLARSTTEISFPKPTDTKLQIQFICVSDYNFHN